MREYKNKEELKSEINKSFGKYISEFENIPEAMKDKRVTEVDRTPAENLAYQVGWTTLVLKWEEDERMGLQVKTPSDKFKWNQLGELYQWFTDTYSHLSLQELKIKLTEAINSLTEKERNVITLYYYEEMTLKEISLVLNVSESRVSQLHTKALGRMRKTLGEYLDIIL